MEVGNWFDVSQNLLIQEEQGDMTPKGVVSCCIMLSESKNHEKLILKANTIFSLFYL